MYMERFALLTFYAYTRSNLDPITSGGQTEIVSPQLDTLLRNQNALPSTLPISGHPMLGKGTCHVHTAD